MYYLIGILELLFVVFFLFGSYKKSSLITLADCIKLIFILWLTNIEISFMQSAKVIRLDFL